jgi:hypothetical protein
MSKEEQSVSCLLWPFWAMWRFVASIVEVTGRLVAMIIGLVLMIVGLVLTLTIVGGIVGIPLIVFGFLLMIRGLW